MVLFALTINNGFSDANRNPFHEPVTQNSNSQLPQSFEKSITEVVAVHYANASNLAMLLSDKSLDLISVQGKIIVDQQNNSLFLHDAPTRLVQLKKFIAKLDLPTPQILIKAKIVFVDDTFIKNLGALFSTRSSKPDRLGGFNMDLPSADTPNTIRVPIIRFTDGSLLDMEITALENSGHARLISSPELVTLNRLPAMIESGEEIPYQETTYSGGTSVTFKKAVLRLKVTPQLMPQGRVLLQLEVNQDKVSPLLIKGVPAISTQQLQTQVLVKDQQTIVLGGIYEQENSLQEDGIPGLRKLPVIGGAFQRTKQVNNRRELLIFITPKIIPQ